LERKRIVLKKSLPEDLPPILADAELIRQVLLNLLANAVEAAPENGRIEVKAEAVEQGGKSMIAVHVSDDGPGMSQEFATRIFEPFVTGKPEGTGLGLYISAAIAERHGGRLTLDSTGPGGSRFTLLLPQARGMEAS
jgi:two-component system NtrC family sensor kinase